MLTYGTGRLFEADAFGNFYDYQAQAWLHGRWDVPEPALGGEAFVVNGKVYGYFGPTPALQRLPAIALGVGFGRLTRCCMLVDFAACLLAGYLILRHAAHLGGQIAPPRWLVVMFTIAVGLGSTLFYLGSRAYVYHEAILCGAAFALWSVWCALRYLAAPESRWWIGAAVCGTLAVQARPPAGLYALTLLGCVALNHAITRRRFAPLWVGIVAGLGVLSFNAVGYLKFGVFDGCPLRYHVQYTPERLAAIGGHNFHLSNLRFNADSYLWRSNVTLNRHFPYLYLDYLNRTKEYPESKIDYRDPTLAVPYAMPALVFLALIGLVTEVRSRQSAVTGNRLRALTWVWAAAGPFMIAMLTAVAVTQRYTADFCSFLVPASALGGMSIATCAWHRTMAIVGLLLALFSGVIESTITLHQQRAVVWGIPPSAKAEYERWQRRIDEWWRVSPD
jgi:hypothetical protein